MEYQLTGIATHLDFGFGITGEAYYESAECLYDNRYSIKIIPQGEMPINYLYRHSIELLLKSLIIIFHKKLRLPFDGEPYNTKRPKIYTGGAWKDLFTCHWIDELYNYWLCELLLKHKPDLERIAPNDFWQEKQSISKFFPLIAGYDRDSSFFRYPITKNSTLDPQKYTMQRLDLKRLHTIFDNEDKRKNKKHGGVTMLLKNDNDEIVDGFERVEDVLDNVTHALKEVAYYFVCMHIMTRETLCDGY